MAKPCPYCYGGEEHENCSHRPGNVANTDYRIKRLGQAKDHISAAKDILDSLGGEVAEASENMLGHSYGMYEADAIEIMDHLIQKERNNG